MTLNEHNQSIFTSKNEVKINDQILKSFKDIELGDSIKEKSLFNLESTKNQDEIESPLYKGKKLKFKGILLILSLTAAAFAGCSSWSLVAPFLPRVVEAKGLSLVYYSLIFSIYEFNYIYLPPFFSKLAIAMTPKYLLITSMFIIGWCSSLFGILDYVRNGQQFFMLSIIVRTVWSLGGVGCTTTTNLLGTLMLPNHIPTVYATIKIGVGIGCILGPVMGGFLFEYGGFPLPFLFVAALSFLSIILVGTLVQNELKPKNKKEEKSTTILQALQVPGVVINLIMSTITCFSVGFNEVSLDFHLREIDPTISPSKSGQIFLIQAAIYIVSTMFYARIAEKCSNSYYHSFLGCFLFIVSFCIVGPLPTLPIKPSVLLVILSQCSSGLAMGILFVLSYDDCVKEAKKYLPDNDSTIAIISSLYTVTYGVGYAGGPFFGGQLIDIMGYRPATVPMLIGLICFTLLVAVYIFKIKKDPIKQSC